MSKTLVGNIPPEAQLPGKIFIGNIKGDDGAPGIVDPAIVEQMVEDYLDANPPGAYNESFVQSTPSNEWVIIHSLPFNPSVTIIDSAGTRIETEIIYDTPTQVRSKSIGAFSGTAYLS